MTIDEAAAKLYPYTTSHNRVVYSTANAWLRVFQLDPAYAKYPNLIDDKVLELEEIFKEEFAQGA